MRGIMLAIAPLGLAATAAFGQEVSGLWSYQFQNGVGEYLTGQWDRSTGGALNLTCRSDGTASIMAQISGKAPAPGTTLTLTTSSRAGSQRFAFAADRKGAVVVPVKDARFGALWAQLRARDTVAIGYSDGQASVQSLAGAQKLLPARPCG